MLRSIRGLRCSCGRCATEGNHSRRQNDVKCDDGKGLNSQVWSSTKVKSNLMIGKAVRVALLMGVGVTVAAPAVFAQDASQSNQEANQNQQNSSTTQQLGKVEVTGTRILRTSIETAQPITIITQKQIQASGLLSIGDVLSSITQATSALNSQDNNNGGPQGQSEIDLRYFGAGRVLILVNGQRWTNNIDGSVDLNTIPSSIVDHIEILEDGASAIYGSDAITGVINIITVKNFDGAEAHAFFGEDDAHGDGGGFDGRQQSYDFTMGGSIGSRGNVVFNASYTEQDPIWVSNRTYSNAFGPFAAAAGDNLVNSWFPNGRFILADPSGTGVGQATPNPGTPFDTLDMTLINAPTQNPMLANFRNIESTDWVAQEAWLQTPRDSKSLFFQGHYDLADNLTFTSMAQAVLNTGSEYLSPVMVSLGQSGFFLRNNASIGVGANNPYNPFHQDLVANSSQWCPSGALAAGPNKGQACQQNKLLILLGKNIQDAGPRLTAGYNTNYTFRMGLNGYFDALGNEWDWSAGSNFGQAEDLTNNYNMLNTVNVATALDAPGYAQCNGPGQSTPASSGQSVEVGNLYYPILIPGCVPLNLFGGDTFKGYGSAPNQGSVTQAMLKYLLYTDPEFEWNRMYDYDVNLTGDLFQLPAGPLAAAVGAESLEQINSSQVSGLEESQNA
ncbi:MAG: TonB-dependent receptor, partial [Gammaproteobacteria bacterium]